MLKPYLDYINDNPENYWFKAKLYGWGWMPAKWQGWLVLFIYAVAVLFFALTIDENSPTREVVFTFLFPLLFLTVTLITICFKKGEPPKWQWGLKNKK